MKLERIETELANISARLKPLFARQDKLNREKRKLESLKFIKTHNITKADVEMPDGDDRPYFNVISNFARWLKSNSNKRFAGWNNTIYFRSDLLANRMPHDMPGRISDL